MVPPERFFFLQSESVNFPSHLFTLWVLTTRLTCYSQHNQTWFIRKQGYSQQKHWHYKTCFLNPCCFKAWVFLHLASYSSHVPTTLRQRTISVSPSKVQFFKAQWGISSEVEYFISHKWVSIVLLVKGLLPPQGLCMQKSIFRGWQVIAATVIVTRNVFRQLFVKPSNTRSYPQHTGKLSQTLHS